MKCRGFRAALLMAALLTLGSPAPASQAAPKAALGAPVLKWQRGGCFASWCQTGWYSSPAVADLDSDGKAEVIWGSYDVVALNGEDGSLQWRAANGSRVWPGVAVADLTGDGSLEVVAGRGGDQVTAYRADGSTLWSKNPFGAGEVRSLAVADLDGDGPREVIVGRASGGDTKQVHVFEANGAPRSGFPARRDGEQGYGWGMYNNNLAVADLDGDGDREIIAPTDTHYITALDKGGNQLAANAMYGAGRTWARVGVHVLQEIDLQGYADCGDSPPAPLARRLRPNFANNGPAIGDLDGNGSLEIVATGDVYDCDAGDPDGDLYHLPWILKSDRTRWSGSGFDWTVLPTPEAGSGPLSQDYDVIQNAAMSTVLADVDGDGQKEILLPSYDGRLHVWWLDKTEHGAWPYDVPGSGIRFASEPAVADLDGDGDSEIIFTSWPENGGGRVGQLHILDSNASVLFAVNLPAPFGSATWNGALGAPTIANIDADADMEVVVGTVSSGVVAYDLPGTAGAVCRWCTGRGSYARTAQAGGGNTFTARMVNSVARIAPSGTTTLQLRIALDGTFGAPIAVSASADRPGLTVAVVGASTVTAPATVTVQVTDTTGGPALPGAWYTVTASATGGGTTRTASASVLVGGAQTFLPVESK